MAVKGGRPPKLTPAVQKAIVAGVKAGVPRKHVARSAGVGESTLRTWLAAGRRQKSGPYRALLAAVKKAESDSIAARLADVRRAASPRLEEVVETTTTPDGSRTKTTRRRVFDWTAAAWILERRHPEEFGSDRRRVKELERVVADLSAKLSAIEASRGPVGTDPHGPAGGPKG